MPEGDFIKKGRVDTSVIVGIVVVLAVVSTVVFSIYYFGFVKPNRAELEDAKESAKQTLNDTLASVDTSGADAKAATFRAEIEEAGSKTEVTSVVEDIAQAYELESKRKELLNKAESATHGSFYTLSDLWNDLKSEISSKTSLSQLNSFEGEGTITDQANLQWRSLLNSVIGDVSDNKVVLREKDSPYYWEYMTEEEARSLVQSESWRKLRKLTFEEAGSYAVPILDTFQRAPTVSPGSTVDVALYDYSTENITVIGGSTTVLKMVYPKDVLGSISWSLADGQFATGYETDVWEAIKAATVGDSDAANIEWTNYADDLIESAKNADLGDYDLQALYIVKVSTQDDAKVLTRYEQYMSDSKDLILLAHTSE